MAPAWLIFEQFPILGIGPGNFRYLCADLILPNLGYPCKNHPHNFYLQILSETGFLGFVSSIVFVGAMICNAFVGVGGRGIFFIQPLGSYRLLYFGQFDQVLIFLGSGIIFFFGVQSRLPWQWPT